MRTAYVISIALAMAFGAVACGSKKHSLGQVEGLQRRATALGCELKYNGFDAECEVLVGSCSCRLHLFVGGKFTGSANTLSGDLMVFGVGLRDCPRSQSLSPLWAILDPMFDSERDRSRLHALIANPPHVEGAPSEARTHLLTDIGPFNVEVTWTPETWTAVKLPDPGLAESWIEIGLNGSKSGNPDELTTMVGDRADYPGLCRDNTRRPWAERPISPDQKPVSP